MSKAATNQALKHDTAAATLLGKTVVSSDSLFRFEFESNSSCFSSGCSTFMMMKQCLIYVIVTYHNSTIRHHDIPQQSNNQSVNFILHRRRRRRRRWDGRLNALFNQARAEGRRWIIVWILRWKHRECCIMKRHFVSYLPIHTSDIASSIFQLTTFLTSLSNRLYTHIIMIICAVDELCNVREGYQN